MRKSILSTTGMTLLVLLSMLGFQPAWSEQGVRYDDGPLLFGPPSFVPDGRIWPNPGSLDYSFISLTADIPAIQVETAIANAFALWSAACPNLAFPKIADNLAAFNDPSATPPAAGDIRIHFGAGNHGDPYPFDGAGGVLAHAFFPPPNGVTAAGDTHFDDAETWSLTGAAGGGQPRDLTIVAAHEFGHALGLAHEPAVDAIMNPFYTGPRVLSADDVAGIRALYCPAAVPSLQPVDIVLLIDITGSMSDDVPNIQASIPAMLNALTNNFSNFRLGLAVHQDFPVSPYGDPGDVPFAVIEPLGTSAATIQTSVQALVATGGADFPESQYHALNQTLAQMSFLAGRLPIIFLMTDADFHDADVEVGYPGPGRTATLAAISASGVKIFTLISANPPDLFPVQGPAGDPAEFDLAALEEEAQELADLTGGGVFFVGTSSSYAAQAIVAAIAVVRLQVPSIPALSTWGYVAFATCVLMVMGMAWVRRASRRRREALG